MNAHTPLRAPENGPDVGDPRNIRAVIRTAIELKADINLRLHPLGFGNAEVRGKPHSISHRSVWMTVHGEDVFVLLTAVAGARVLHAPPAPVGNLQSVEDTAYLGVQGVLPV
jgi:hypothetical protein